MRQKIYVNKKEISSKNGIIEILANLLIYTITLIIADKIFKGLYIENYLYAFIASIIISLFNKILKPFLTIITFPITFITLGLFYPIVNIIILELTDLILMNHFDINGIISPFIIAVFISFMNETIKRLVKKEGN